MKDHNYEKVWTALGGLCVLCFAPAAHVHEIVPKSKSPTDWQDVENRVTLCASCHEKVHAEGPHKYESLLRMARNRLLSVQGE